MKQTLLTRLAAIVISVVLVHSATASWTQVLHNDLPSCDPLNMPIDVDELGSVMVPFPSDELIDHLHVGVSSPVCFAHDDPTMPDQLVEITNLTNRTFTEVWYVADEGTRISNVDGLAEDLGVVASGFGIQREAFRIDNDLSDPGGIHHPLVFESVPNGVFDPGETWQFVLQDYANVFGAAPDAFTSIGVGLGSVDVPGLMQSSGSIVAIPEPASAAAFVLSLLAAVSLRRRNQ